MDAGGFGSLFSLLVPLIIVVVVAAAAWVAFRRR